MPAKVTRTDEIVIDEAIQGTTSFGPTVGMPKALIDFEKVSFIFSKLSLSSPFFGFHAQSESVDLHG